MSLEVIHVPERHRYEASLDGVPVGFARYHVNETEGSDATIWVFDSTEVDPQFRGQGIAGTLLTTTFDQVRELGVTVRPTCPFVIAWFDAHPDYQDLLETS